MQRFIPYLLGLALIVACSESEESTDHSAPDAGSLFSGEVKALPDNGTSGGPDVNTGCTPNKTCADYPGQCGQALSDGCEGTLDCANACSPTEVCVNDQCLDEQSVCTPKCAGKNCGSDSCGGECGNCNGGEVCVEGNCQQDCVKNCADNSCGPDGCGGSCGDCGDGKTCVEGQCTADCVKNCADKVCGDDGCGGSCGDCNDDETCVEGQCKADCVSDCVDKFCGDDGCGGTCGTCSEGDVCNEQGECIAKPFGAIVINEVQPDPEKTPMGDTNCDGVLNNTQDEFVEIVNVGNVAFTLDGYYLEDNSKTVHVFPQGSILPVGGVMVVFGGGTPLFDGTSVSDNAWCKQPPLGMIHQTASTGGLKLNNDGDTLTLKSVANTPQQIFEYGKGDDLENESWNTSPELSGKNFVKHSQVPGAIGPHSPGTKVDGTAF